MAPDAATLPSPAVTLREAAAALGVSEAAARRMLKSGALVGGREPRPQGYVWRVHLPACLTLAPGAAPAPAADGTLRRQHPSPVAEGAGAEALAAYAAAVIAPHLATIEHLSTELTVRAQQFGALEQQLTAQAETIGALRAELAAARRPPWWRRWWGR